MLSFRHYETLFSLFLSSREKRKLGTIKLKSHCVVTACKLGLSVCGLAPLAMSHPAIFTRGALPLVRVVARGLIGLLGLPVLGWLHSLWVYFTKNRSVVAAEFLKNVALDPEDAVSDVAAGTIIMETPYREKSVRRHVRSLPLAVHLGRILRARASLMYVQRDLLNDPACVATLNHKANELLVEMERDGLLPNLRAVDRVSLLGGMIGAAMVPTKLELGVVEAFGDEDMVDLQFDKLQENNVRV